MYREPAPKPFDARRLHRWRRSLFARRRRHVVQKYTLPWSLAFLAMALAALTAGLLLPYTYVLACRDGAPGCVLRVAPLVGTVHEGAVWRISAHDTTLGDEAKGPKLLVEQDHELPEWFAREDAFELAARATDHDAPPMVERLGGSPLPVVLLALAAGFLLGTVLITTARTVLTATIESGNPDVDEGAGRARAELVVSGWLRRRRAITIAQIGEPTTASIDDSTFERLKFGPKGDPITIEANPRAVAETVAFLRSLKGEGENARRSPLDPKRSSA